MRFPFRLHCTRGLTLSGLWWRNLSANNCHRKKRQMQIDQVRTDLSSPLWLCTVASLQHRATRTLADGCNNDAKAAQGFFDWLRYTHTHSNRAQGERHGVSISSSLAIRRMWRGNECCVGLGELHTFFSCRIFSTGNTYIYQWFSHTCHLLYDFLFSPRAVTISVALSALLCDNALTQNHTY